LSLGFLSFPNKIKICNLQGLRFNGIAKKILIVIPAFAMVIKRSFHPTASTLLMKMVGVWSKRERYPAIAIDK